MKISADDFGLSINENRSIIKAIKKGIVNNVCIILGNEAFDHSINSLKELKEVTVDIHLNISEGKPVSKNKLHLLTDNNNNFNVSFIKALFMSYNKKFLNEIYDEYKAQIEYVINLGIAINAINSHIHIHAIPNIFKIVCKLAKEYNINIVRTNYEKLYLINDIKIILSIKFIINIVKNIVLKIFTIYNMKIVNEYKLETNKYLIGILYTTMMNQKAIDKGIMACNNENNIEVILHFLPQNLEYAMIK